MSRTGDLVMLQDVDSRAGRDGARLAVLEARLVRDEELETLRVELRRAARSRETADAAVAAQEIVVSTLRGRARELDRHLYDGSVRNPQELLGMQHELETVRHRVATEEESELALMERAESLATTVRELTARVESREREHQDSLPGLSAEVAALHEALETLAGERRALLASLDPADLALYDRLRARVSPAVVHLEGDLCGGCRMPFAGSEVRAVRAGTSLVQCSSCDRIVVP